MTVVRSAGLWPMPIGAPSHMAAASASTTSCGMVDGESICRCCIYDRKGTPFIDTVPMCLLMVVTPMPRNARGVRGLLPYLPEQRVVIVGAVPIIIIYRNVSQPYGAMTRNRTPAVHFFKEGHLRIGGLAKMTARLLTHSNVGFHNANGPENLAAHRGLAVLQSGRQPCGHSVCFWYHRKKRGPSGVHRRHLCPRWAICLSPVRGIKPRFPAGEGAHAFIIDTMVRPDREHEQAIENCAVGTVARAIRLSVAAKIHYVIRD